MKQLFKRVAEISSKYEQLNKISGNRFNIFEVINVTTDEVRLHSKFIAELLNPKGLHGQDDSFLKLFTEQLNIELDTKSAVITVEKNIGAKTEITGGYLDIFISDKIGNSITIENKIYASDQNAQLLRYYNYNPNNLLYLNLWGTQPAETSYIFKNKEKKKLKGKTSLVIDEDFKIISYKTDIIQWLTNCRKEAVELPLLREGITHYINLIKILTGQSGNTKMNKEIRNYIASSPENLKQASLVEQNFIDAKIEIQWEFWEDLKNKLTSKGLELIEGKSVKKENVKNYYTKSRNRDLYYGFWSKIFQKDAVTIHLGIEIYHCIYFGFTIEKNGKGGIASKKENSVYKDLVLEINPNYKTNEHWLGYRDTNKKLDFRAFNSTAVFNLADSEKLDQLTSNIATNIINDIEALKDKLQKI